MEQETKICQNCKASFTIDAQDFAFYEKIKVPAPTWCPECRLVRKLLFRNERALYKRRCGATNADILSVYSPDKIFKVYEQKYWWSDKWNPMDYGFSYDWNKSFFGQFKQLMQDVPHPNLVSTNSVNSEYCNSVLNCKNCYLIFAAVEPENCGYGANVDFDKDCFDSKDVAKNELCYEVLSCHNDYKLIFSAFSDKCSNSAFLWDCRNCSYCFGCVGLRAKSYHIFNKPYTEKEYFREIKRINTGSFKEVSAFKEKFRKFRLIYPYRCGRIQYSVNSSGDNIYNAKNCYHCFDVTGESIEDSRYMFLVYGRLVSDCQSIYTVSAGDFCYDSISIRQCNSILFSKKIWTGHHIQYSYNCHNCNNLFGCIGLHNKEYCILNKQHTKEEYEKLVPKIIQHMNDMPYVNRKGVVYKYGEFFPSEISPFAYNETIAQEYFPLTKEQALEQGYAWKDPEERNISMDIHTEDLPDHIKDVKDDIVGKVIECQHKGQCNEQCTSAFKIIPQELEFYRKMSLPIPRFCPNCRHYLRLKQRNPLKLWHRQCMCNTNNVYKNTIEHFHKDKPCPNEFETSYAPDRPEIVYCEECYKREVN